MQTQSSEQGWQQIKRLCNDTLLSLLLHMSSLLCTHQEVQQSFISLNTGSRKINEQECMEDVDREFTHNISCYTTSFLHKVIGPWPPFWISMLY
jgi:hypothetical protein